MTHQVPQEALVTAMNDIAGISGSVLVEVDFLLMVIIELIERRKKEGDFPCPKTQS